MKLTFRIPDQDDEETDEGPDLEELTPKVLILAAGAAAAQVIWPVPWPFMVLFGALGVAMGMSWLLRVGKWGTMSGIIMWTLFDLFTPPTASIGFVVRTAFVVIAAFGLTLGVGIWVQRRQAEE